MMDYSVKGITFTRDQLELVRLSEIVENSISSGHLFTFVKERPFLLLRAGDFVDQDFLEKYQARGVESLYILKVSSEQDLRKFKSLFTKFKTSKTELEKRRVKDELIKVFADDFWKHSDKSFLSFVQACFEQFYNLPEEVVTSLQDSSTTLYSRALLSSSLSVMNCVIHSIHDLNFVSDVYNAAFLMDCSLGMKEDFSYFLKVACEKERSVPGDGIAFLRNRSDLDELIKFQEHPNLSADLATKYSESFFNPEVSELIRFHHERADGTGFPNGYKYSAIAESDTLLMFGDYVTPFEEHIFKSSDGKEIVKENFMRLLRQVEKSQLPIKNSMDLWQQAMKWAINIGTLDQSEVA